MEVGISSRKDEGRPFGIGFQEQVSNRSKQLLLRVVVVSVGRKVRVNLAGKDQQDECK